MDNEQKTVTDEQKFAQIYSLSDKLKALRDEKEALETREKEVEAEIKETDEAIAPTFYSIGNHESRWNELDKQIVRNSGTVLLDNEYCRFKDMVIGGISSIPKDQKDNSDDINNIKEDIIEKMKKEEGKKILLLHEPQLYDKYGLQDQAIDLVVSGHAHGGQWRLFGHGVFAPGQGILPKYTKGFYNGNLLVSAGMTNTAPIPRFFNPTEIVIVETAM